MVHLPRFEVAVSLVDSTDLSAVKAAMRPDTKAVLIETPGNPIVSVSDIDQIAKMAHTEGKTIKEIAKREKVLPEDQLEDLLN